MAASVRAERKREPAGARAVIVQDHALDPRELLATALDAAGLWTQLASARRAAAVSAAKLRIVILPDLDFFAADAPTFTDPALVEHLIDLLRARKFSNVVIGSAPNQWSRWLENRDVPALADLAGYRFRTPGGCDYDVLDFSGDAGAAGFPPESVLHDTALSRRWQDAHFRINFAKNKTDEAHGFALGLQNLLGVLPLRDKTLHYRHRLPAPEVAVALLREAPPHFTIIDAVVSSHGFEGGRIARPLATGTIVASANALLADWAASLKMQTDPFTSPLNGLALREIGLPDGYVIAGPLDPYEGWSNVPPLLRDSVQRRNASPAFSQLAQPWFQEVDREFFPFKEIVHDRANAAVRKILGGAAGDGGALLAAIVTNYALATAHHSAETLRTVFAKERLRWRETGLGFDPAAHTLADYEAAAPYMEQWERIVAQTPPEPGGLRWRTIDGSVVFAVAQVLPIPFQRWCKRVDIAKSVQSMNDYIGGACVSVARDARGRVTHQAERNIYLPQPNWMAFFGGDCIDVCKLEHVRYGANEQRIYWRTIASANHSAEFDDGIVGFARAGSGKTEVKIIARQKFALPLIWQAVNMDLFPAIKNVLVVQAYENYFRGTLRNFQAQYDGQPHRIGQPWDPLDGENQSAVESLLALLGMKPADFEKLAGGLRGVPAGFAAERSSGPVAPEIDAHGFRHFPGGGAAPDAFTGALSEGRGFLAGLAGALRKDLGLDGEDRAP